MQALKNINKIDPELWVPSHGCSCHFGRTYDDCNSLMEEGTKGEKMSHKQFKIKLCSFISSQASL